MNKLLKYGAAGRFTLLPGTATVVVLAILLLALIPAGGIFLDHAQAQGAANFFTVNSTGNGNARPCSGS